ncbi:hypothetical protein PMI15_00263 [Polaromonas sp. CF318]|uniref:DUF1566 domain-containing protein n=1 Tax=Polaromonas sp. CF318 TaxID=1144318 RepID=UPI0002710F9A|nr:DUF1566 domain-containing protein [Polaromonas sp. CF318]EJL90450.1 hypothetical protein PMI15_00263 [Polaromonas sp. CF318]
MKPVNFTLPAFGSVIAGQAGILAAIMRGPSIFGVEQPPYALLISDKSEGETDKHAYGNYGTDVAGATSRTNGKANTDALVLAQSPAALWVRELSIGGHSDWYVPSLGELNAAAANVPEQFEPKGIYQASTQLSRNLAFVQDFESGRSNWYLKDYEFRVRAFRAIPLELLTT